VGSTTIPLIRPSRPSSEYRGIFRDDLPARAVYAEAAGIAQITPRAVAVPADVDDVLALARWSRDAEVPLVPRGSGSSMGGGAIGSGVIVDLSRLNAIGQVDVARRRVTVGPGAIRAQVDAAAAAVGLRFPVDPSSGAFCTIGGMTATNAAGAHSLRHGSMRPWVMALDCVFADGTRATIRRGTPAPSFVYPLQHLAVRKNSSGYALDGDLVDLLVGSEGTLALFVGIELALDSRPSATTSVFASFPTLEAAVAGASLAREAGAAACELLDRTFLDFAKVDCPPGTEAVLLIEFEDTRDGIDLPEATKLIVASDAHAQRALWDLRHAASPILSGLDPSLKSMQFIEDGCVPPDKLADYVRGVRRALDAHQTRGVIFGHAGDAHVHVNPLIDVRDPSWRDRVAGLLAEVVALTGRLGGTLSGEHGDGRLRAPLLDAIWQPSTLQQFAAVKKEFDPSGRLNPGVKVALPGEQPLGDIKYDPALEPLPTPSRLALSRVERERAYATPRLTLLAETS
jgi:FAD/FMN-containing dehydrogenase